jgi:hypothetical protein
MKPFVADIYARGKVDLVEKKGKSWNAIVTIENNRIIVSGFSEIDFKMNDTIDIFGKLRRKRYKDEEGWQDDGLYIIASMQKKSDVIDNHLSEIYVTGNIVYSKHLDAFNKNTYIIKISDTYVMKGKEKSTTFTAICEDYVNPYYDAIPKDTPVEIDGTLTTLYNGDLGIEISRIGFYD